MSVNKDKSRAAFIMAVLALVTLAVFWRVSGYGFVFFDDSYYVARNDHVTRGLTWPAFVWAWHSNVVGHWHPLTMLSHMLDCQLYGLKAGRHHLTSLLLHITNACLVFVWLRRLTGAIWKSALVAALFAWHPLHVESVVWIAERKDVLSTFFLLLALLAYTCYAEKSKAQSPRSKVWYGLTLLFFALGLMSKAMVVTLPFVLLLLDYWPLKRGAWCVVRVKKVGSTPALASGAPAKSLLQLVWEKIPFFAVAVASCVVTFLAQKKEGALESIARHSPGDRVANALVAYVRYLKKTVWPTDLAVLYPHPDSSWPAWKVAVAAAVLLGVSWLAIKFLRERPWLAVGWFWFLGILVPVLGLVQAGRQSMADRYSYVPLIGLFIIFAWGLEEWASSVVRRRVAEVLAALALLACLGLTWIQVGYWKDSEVLFKHDLKVVGTECLACQNLGVYLLSKDRTEEGLDYLHLALKSSPGDAPNINSAIAQGYTDLGNKQYKKGNYMQAAEHYSQALELGPDNAYAHENLGLALAQQGKASEAIRQYKIAIELKSDLTELHRDLGTALAGQGDLAGAVTEFETAAKADPTDAGLQTQLAVYLSAQNKSPEAITHLREAVRIYREALRKTPDSPELLNNLAWLLAANANAEIRNGPEAVTLARRACEATHWQQAVLVGTLAAAYAEAGQFKEAAESARKAQKIALAAGKPEIADRNTELLKLYEAGKQYHEP